jgi:hypothetical protein
LLFLAATVWAAGRLTLAHGSDPPRVYLPLVANNASADNLTPALTALPSVTPTWTPTAPATSSPSPMTTITPTLTASPTVTLTPTPTLSSTSTATSTPTPLSCSSQTTVTAMTTPNESIQSPGYSLGASEDLYYQAQQSGTSSPSAMLEIKDQTGLLRYGPVLFVGSISGAWTPSGPNQPPDTVIVSNTSGVATTLSLTTWTCQF